MDIMITEQAALVKTFFRPLDRQARFGDNANQAMLRHGLQGSVRKDGIMPFMIEEAG